MRGDSPLWGVLTGSPLPETVLNVYSAFQEGSLYFLLGVGWGWGVSWAWSGDNTKVSLTFHSCGWLLGCQVRDAENIVIQKYILIPICTLNKYAGRAQVQVTKMTCSVGVDFFSGCFISIPEEDNHGRAPVILHCPGRWRFWKRLGLEDGLAPHGPTLLF